MISDKLRSTLIVFAAFMLIAVLDGIMCVIGVYVSYWMQEWHATRFQLDWIGSIQMGLAFCLGPFTGRFINRFGLIWVAIFGGVLCTISFIVCAFTIHISMLYIFYGIFSGFGIGLAYMSAVVSVTVNFEEKRPIAMGVVTCGTGVGCACLSTLMPTVISRIGWKNSMYILAAIAFTTVIYSVLLRSKARHVSIRPSLNLPVIMPQLMALDSNLSETPKMPSQIMSSTFAFFSTWDVEQAKKRMYLTSFLGNVGSFVYLEGLDNFLKSKSRANKEPLRLLKNFQFIILFLASFFFAFTFMTPIVYLFDRLRQKGIPDENISLILSAYGVFGAIARLSMGIISSFSWCKKHIFLFFWIIISSVSNIASNYMTTTWNFALFSCTLATAQGAFIVLQPLMLVEIVLQEDLTDALGLMLLASGTGYLIGTPMMALVFDHWKTYEACYFACGVILAFTALLTTTIVIAYIRQVLMEKYERRLKMRLANQMSNWIRQESSSSQE